MLLEGIITDIKNAVKGLDHIDKLVARIESFFLILILTFLVFSEIGAVLARWLYRTGFIWLEEILMYLVIWIGLIGASLATRSKKHITIELVSKFVGRGGKWISSIITNMTGFAITCCLAVAAFQYIDDERIIFWMSGEKKGAIEIFNLNMHAYTHSIYQHRKNILKSGEEAEARILRTQEFLENDWRNALDEIGRIQKVLNGGVEEKEKEKKIEEEWIHKIWEESWKANLKKEWQEKGEDDWKREGKLAGVPSEKYWFKVSFKTWWLKKMWNEKWQKEWNQAVEAPEVSKDGEDKWIQKMWVQKWQKEWDKVWAEQGEKEWFKKNWTREWIQKQWKKAWREEWQSVLSPTYAKGVLSECCPVCGEKLPSKGTCPKCRLAVEEVPLKIPRWWLLAIIPISFTIISFRFALHLLRGIFFPEELVQEELQEELPGEK